MFNSVRLSWGRHCSVGDYHLSPQACQSSEKLSRVGFLPSFCQQATVWNCPNIFITRFYHNGSVIRPVLSASYKICSLNHMIYFCCNLVAWELMLKIILIKTHLIQQSHQQVCSLIPCEEVLCACEIKMNAANKSKDTALTRLYFHLTGFSCFPYPAQWDHCHNQLVLTIKDLWIYCIVYSVLKC